VNRLSLKSFDQADLTVSGFTPAGYQPSVISVFLNMSECIVPQHAYKRPISNNSVDATDSCPLYLYLFP